jgi:hypothetical protein
MLQKNNMKHAESISMGSSLDGSFTYLLSDLHVYEFSINIIRYDWWMSLICVLLQGSLEEKKH